MHKIGVLYNYKRDVKELAQKVISYLQAQGAEVFAPSEPYDIVDQSFLKAFFEKNREKCEGIIVLGGDGTLLSVALQASACGLPIIGINGGHLGFLTEIDPADDLPQALNRILNNEYYLEKRMMLKVSLLRRDKMIREFHCLNDCVITKESFDGLIYIDAYSDDKPSLSYNGDGLVVATPTGASGYSLSAGGPLVSPEMDAMILTPVSAHCLYSRSLVIDAERKISLVAAMNENNVILCIDGKTSRMKLVEGDKVLIEKSELRTDFMRFNDQSYFYVLNEKLRERT